MIINLDELNYQKEIIIDDVVLKDDDLDKRIHDLKNATVKGKLFQNSNSNIILQCIFEGDMIINDSITLDLIPYHFKIEIDENIDDLEENYQNVYENKQNILDLKKILWENIVLEVPISYSVNKDASLKGEGWELLSDKSKSNEIDPRLKDLEKLLKGDD